jgi:hypothetical protein
VDLALWDFKVNALENGTALDCDFEAFNLKDGIGQLRESPGC